MDQVRLLLHLKGFTQAAIDSILEQDANISSEDIIGLTLIQIQDFLGSYGIQLQAEEDISMGIEDVLDLEDSTLEERRVERLIIEIVEDNLPLLKERGYALYDDDGIYAISPVVAYLLVLSLLSEDETIVRDLILEKLEDYLIVMSRMRGIELTQEEVEEMVYDLWNNRVDAIKVLIPDLGVQSQAIPIPVVVAAIGVISALLATGGGVVAAIASAVATAESARAAADAAVRRAEIEAETAKQEREAREREAREAREAKEREVREAREFEIRQAELRLREAELKLREAQNREEQTQTLLEITVKEAERVSTDEEILKEARNELLRRELQSRLDARRR